MRILSSATAIWIIDFSSCEVAVFTAICIMYTYYFFAFLSNLQFSFLPYLNLPREMKGKECGVAKKVANSYVFFFVPLITIWKLYETVLTIWLFYMLLALFTRCSSFSNGPVALSCTNWRGFREAQGPEIEGEALFSADVNCISELSFWEADAPVQ